jgi:hypothetical protein
MTEHDETVKFFVDGLSFLTVVGTLAEALPAIAATFTIVWTAIRIWETKTVQRWLSKEKAGNAINE